MKSHAPRLAAASLIFSAIAGGAIGAPKPAPHILVEMRAITAPAEAAGIFRGAKHVGGGPILDTEEFQAGLQKLAEMASVDTVSAPNVTTRSGQRAMVEIGTEDAGVKFDVLALSFRVRISRI